MTTRRHWIRILSLTLLFGVPLTFVYRLQPTPAADSTTGQVGQSVHLPGGEQRVTLRLRDLDLDTALRLIGQRAHVSISATPDVKGSVNFDFYDEPLNRVLEIILDANNLQLRQIGDTYLVSQSPAAGLSGVKVYQLNYAAADTLDKILVSALQSAGIPKPEAQLVADARSNSIIASGNDYFQSEVARLIARLDQPQGNQIFRLNYIKAEDAAKLLSDGIFAGESGTGVKFIPILRDNALMVVASPSDLKLVGQTLAKLDRRLRQVIVDVKVVELNGNASNNLGVTFNAQSGTLSGTWDPTNGLAADYNPVQQQVSQITAHLDALVRDNKARLLASPSIVAMDSKTSTIEITDDIVQKIEYTTTSNTTATITNQNITLGTAGITLSITPKINPDGYISMELKPEISFVRQTVPGTQANSILATLKSTRKLDTPEVRVRNGETLIIGGLDQDQEQDNVDKIPVLGDIPVLGTLFRRTQRSKVTTELVMMVTPHVVPEGQHAPPAATVHS